MALPKEIKEIVECIKAGDHLLTVNVRLSRYLRMQYDSCMMAGSSAWPTPVIMPLSAWIASIWNDSWPDKPLLSSVRASALWEKVVSNDKFLSKEILLNRGVARTAYDAYSLIREYRVALPEDIYLTEEGTALKRWIGVYENEVERLGFIEQTAVPDRVIRLIKDGRINLPERIVFAGFDELTPRTESVIKAVEDRGGKVIFWPEKPGSSRVDISNLKPFSVRGYADEVEEVVQAARWARKTLRPDVRIGFIVPDIERYKDIIKREFTAELNPDAVFPWKETKEVFNISLGSPLSTEPIVKTALDILSINEEAQEINAISSILLSPYFAASDDEYLAFARLDAVLKKENRFTVGLSDIGRAVERHKVNHLAEFRKRLDGWLKALKESSKNQLPSWWAHNFSALLKDCGWPSRRFALGSVEYQALKAWNGLLKDLASLDEILGRIGRIDAVSQLTKLANDTIHQPETEECPIQVMGLLESSGIYFDHVWMIGMHSDAFPAQPSPNPFIPLSVQKKTDLPHSSPERELEFARVAVRRVFNSAHSIEISYPKVVDNKELVLSPLFDCSENPPPSPFYKGGEIIPTLSKGGEGGFITESSRIKDSVHLHGAIEDMPVDRAIPPSAEELATVSGGTAIIKNQSACPFRAFAIHRLNACGVEAPGLGLSVQNRGTIVHAALKAFWDRVKDSNTLREINAYGELDRYINDAVDEAFRRHYFVEPLSGKYLELEKVRVIGLLKEWLEGVELARGQFTVDQTECTKEMDIEGLRITARFDRVDTVGDGYRAIIDYKTGDCSKNDLLTDRPKEPQLLIYNLSESFDAISFAKVKPGECGFVGISREDGILPKVLPFEKDSKLREKLPDINSWDELMERWKSTVKELAGQFMNGEAAVDPTEKGCEYCDLKGLCRIFEAETRLEGEEDE